MTYRANFSAREELVRVYTAYAYRRTLVETDGAK